MSLTRKCLLILLLSFGLHLSGCANAPFKVADRVEVPAINITPAATNTKLELRAQVLNEDEVIGLFDGNLLLAGIIPIRVALTNQTQQPLTFTNRDFQLVTPQGQLCVPVKAKDVVGRLIKYYGYRVYNEYAYKEMQAKFISHDLDLSMPLAVGESRQGMLYFKPKKGKTIPVGLKLNLMANSIKKESLTIELNN